MTRRSAPMRGRLSHARAPIEVPAGLVTRGLQADDGDELARLMSIAYRGTVDDRGEDEAWHAAEARRTLAGEFGAVIWDASVVACSARKLAGACIVTDDGPHVLLAFALVVPEWQGRGVGSALIARSAHALLRRGDREWTLAVTDGNPAQRLYARLGFVVDESLRSAEPTPQRPNRGDRSA